MPARPCSLLWPQPQRLAFHFPTRPVIPRKRVAHTPKSPSMGAVVVQKCHLSNEASRPSSPTSPSASTSTQPTLTTDERILAEYARKLPAPLEPEVRFDGTRAEGLQYPDAGQGHKFGLPDTLALKVTDHLRRRYDPVIDQMTKCIMRDGKLSAAQRNVSIILDILRTAPAPNASARPLLSDSSLNTENIKSVAVPRDQLPLSPIQYLTSAIDSVAPLVKIRQQKGMAGGGASTPIPVPLRVKQRRRTAIQWILQASESRKELKLAERLAKEVIKVAEGTSSAWEKRQQVHRLAVAARSNIRLSMMKRRRR